MGSERRFRPKILIMSFDHGLRRCVLPIFSDHDGFRPMVATLGYDHAFLSLIPTIGPNPGPDHGFRLCHSVYRLCISTMIFATGSAHLFRPWVISMGSLYGLRTRGYSILIMLLYTSIFCNSTFNFLST